jgi:hypothetical protein
LGSNVRETAAVHVVVAFIGKTSIRSSGNEKGRNGILLPVRLSEHVGKPAAGTTPCRLWNSTASRATNTVLAKTFISPLFAKYKCVYVMKHKHVTYDTYLNLKKKKKLLVKYCATYIVS